MYLSGKVLLSQFLVQNNNKKSNYIRLSGIKSFSMKDKQKEKKSRNQGVYRKYLQLFTEFFCEPRTALNIKKSIFKTW